MLRLIPSPLRRRLHPALLTVVASWGARLVSACAQLVTIPLLVQSMGSEAYGVYVVTISLFAWYLMADLGTGYSLQNQISKRRASNAGYANDIVSGVGGLLALLPVLIAGAVTVAPFIARSIWTPEQLELSNSGHLLAISGAVFVIAAFGNLAYRILYAEQTGYVANVLQALASLIALGLVVSGARLELATADRLVAMVMAFAAPQVVLSVGMLALSFTRALAEGGRFHLSNFVHLLRASTGFLAFGVLSLITLQIDYMVLVAMVSPIEVVKYNVIAKVLGLTLILFQAVLQAQWPSCAEAANRHDWPEVKNRLLGMIRIGTLLVLGGALIYALFERTIMALVSAKATAPLGLTVVAFYSTYLLIRVWSDTFAMVLQSMGRLKIFVIFVPFQAGLSLLLQVLLTRSFGVVGLIGGLLASFLLTSCWVLPFYLRRVQRATQAHQALST